MLPPKSTRQAIEAVLREEWGRILAALTGSLGGDIGLAEDCLQEALVKAMEVWARDGLPRVPAAWLITTARRGAIDRLRRDQVLSRKAGDIAYLESLERMPEEEEVSAIPDKRLEMIFTCCHPALEEKTQVALTLRTLGGLNTDEIAAAFLDRSEAMAQRLVRAKRKIAAAGIPYAVPGPEMWAERLGAVLGVIYQIFNAGYFALGAGDVVRADLTGEAIRLGRILRGLVGDEPEVAGLLALMLLSDARRAARVGPEGEMVPLEAQNRARWDRGRMEEGRGLLPFALACHPVGAYAVQAAISALHCESPSWEATDWPQIAALYAVLHTIQPTPVVRVNQAVALSYAGSLGVGLAMLDEAAGGGALERYQPYFAARADVLARMGQVEAARASYDRAIDLTANGQEVAFLREKRGRLV